MAKQTFENLGEMESVVFKQIIQDEEFSGLMSKFQEEEKHVVVQAIHGMVTSIEKALRKELSSR